MHEEKSFECPQGRGIAADGGRDRPVDDDHSGMRTSGADPGQDSDQPVGRLCLYRAGNIGRLADHAAGLPACIQVERIKIAAYTISGFLAGLAGYLLASWPMAITSNEGSSYLLYAIAAPIIGWGCLHISVSRIHCANPAL